MSELKHSFYLRVGDTGDQIPIFYNCSLNNKPFKKSIRYKIYPELWDKTKQRPTDNKDLIKEYSRHNPNIKITLKNIEHRINNIQQSVDGYILACKLNQTSMDRDRLSIILNESVFKSNSTLDKIPRVRKIIKPGADFDCILDFSIKFLMDITTGTKLIQSGKNIQNRYTEGTIKNYRNFVSIWKEYEQFKNIRFKWSDLSRSFYDDLVQFLNQKNYSKDTIGRFIKHIKTISQAAMDEGIHSNGEFRKPYFKTLKVKKDSIYLTEIELEKLEILDLSGNETQEMVRDVFLLMCYTALRISDIKRLRRENINETPKGYQIKIIIQKTKDSIIIPVKRKAYQILQKYGFRTPQIADQTINDYIKKIAKKSGIEEMVSISETKGGTTRIKSVPKCELITNHTGRRTAATLMYLSQIPTIHIMKITGHTSESSFMKYIRISKEETADQLAENKFFK